MEYHFREVEQKWQKYWAEHKIFKTQNPPSLGERGQGGEAKPKYYVLDMFPYPSGAGLHVGHPLGYIASDIVARYKRHKGFNVLHPMGYDSFGLPAEQYAIQTGQHPELTTKTNIARYREQLDKIGFSFDWDREVRTSNPDYYKWTQWIFIQLFNSWYNPEINKAENINTLIEKFKKAPPQPSPKGREFANAQVTTKGGTVDEKVLPLGEDLGGAWDDLSEKQQSDILLEYRLAYLSDTMVNWCPQLGTVLANEEVKDGVSERGGYPVERKLMKQWSMRITAYAERLLNDLDTLDWTESIKEAQRNWIGKSEGTSLLFRVSPLSFGEGAGGEAFIEVFTTRPDTVFGVSFLTLAPEHELVEKITTPEQKQQVEEYITFAKNRSERERMADVKKITGVFTGAYALHPFTGKQIPIWIGDYVLAGYGTGAVMAVPAHDSRDYAFAKHFKLPIIQVISPTPALPKGRELANTQATTVGSTADGKVSPHGGDLEGAWEPKEGVLINSDFLNGLEVKEAMKKAIAAIEEKELGKGKINYRLRDAIFGRQRYWGEPIPVYYKDGIPHVLNENELPLLLPEVDKYLPTEDGEPPLARAKEWAYSPSPLERGQGGEAYPYEYSTMPGWAGSSWYYLRYMDAHNDKELASKDAINYWQNIDLYIGGSEHATGHLLYVRFWTKFLHDIGIIPFVEPAKKLINQGMIQGRSSFVYRLGFVGHIEESGLESGDFKTLPKLFVSKKFYENQQEFHNQIFKRYSEVLKKYKGETYQMPSIRYHVISPIPVDVNYVENDVLDLEKFKNWREEFANAEFLLEDGKYICGSEVEKMSKSKYNVVNPDDMVEKYGADALRLYEMFLGPLELSKPWNTNGITGVSGFIKKLWRLYHPSEGSITPSPLERGQGGEATKAELKTLHKTIKKITYDIEHFSFNTSVSNFMICVNELTELKCHKREILEPLAILISPYAPHIAEELWHKLGHTESITYAQFPECIEEYLVETAFNYPVSFNGKTRFFTELERSLSKEDIEKEVMNMEQTQKYLEGKTPKKIIVVPNKIINIVV